MQGCCIRFIMFGQVSQIIRNDSRKSNHLQETLWLDLDCATIPDKLHLINDDYDELFCGMIDRRKAFSLISSRGICHRFSPS